MTGHCVRAGFLAMVLATSAAAQTRTDDPLTQARQAYNEQRYDVAIARAAEARGMPLLAPPATVLFARAHLERFRVTADPADLTAARGALKGLQISTLANRDQVEFFIALGESLYRDDQYQFDDRYSAAAEQFELALARADLLDVHNRDLLFDWWALSLERQAQLGPETTRHPLYERIVARAETEAARPDGSIAATYWLAAGACGLGDISRALGVASAGWVRAGALGPRGAALREDLDRLTIQVILPERAKELASGGDARPTLESLKQQWEKLKEVWR